MPVTVQWHDEDNKIIIIHYEGQWSWEEFHKAAETSKKWAEQFPRERVDIIAFMEGGFIPGKMTSLVSKYNAVRNPADNIGLITIVATNSLVNMLAVITMRVVPNARSFYRIARTLQQAESIIRSDRR